MNHEVRPAAVAGTFYPAAPRVLAQSVDELLRLAPSRVEARPPKALVVPHAGYVYSGPIAAAAYATLAPFADRIRRVVLVGPSHRVYFHGIARPAARAFDTPLGQVPVDEEAAQRVPGVAAIAPAHAREHSLEVQLPFLIRVLKSFSIVPLVVGEVSADEVAAVLDALWGGPETVVVVSSDLSHYLPYDSARRVDSVTARSIVELDPEPLAHEQACGATPVSGLVICARRRGLACELLDLRSSGDTAGGRDQVVGYGAFAFYEEDRHGA
jgi:hypothetical protein